MPLLQHAEVYRGGVTDPKIFVETSDCSATVSPRHQSIDLRFRLASAGGGATSVLLRIGKDDFQAILREIASEIPETAGVLMDCASIASEKMFLRAVFQLPAGEDQDAGCERR